MTAFKRAVFPVGLIPWLPRGELRQRLARAAAERGDPRALRAAPGDAAVMSSLGLHRAALACPEERDPHLIARAATGSIGPLLAAVSQAVSLPAPVRQRIVRAVAAHDPYVALALASADAPLDRAAIAIAADAPEIAAACRLR